MRSAAGTSSEPLTIRDQLLESVSPSPFRFSVRTPSPHGEVQSCASGKMCAAGSDAQSSSQKPFAAL